MARPQAFERELKLATAEFEPSAMRRELAAFARKSLAEVQHSGEFPENYERFVNGRAGASEDAVILPGPIVYQGNRLPEATEYGYVFWKGRSPRKSGGYIRSIIVLVNGRQTRDFKNIPDDAEVIIVATVPFARKVEVGAMTMRVPPGIAEDTRQAIMRRFGNVVLAQKRFVNLAGGYVLREGRQRGREITYPAVAISHRF